MKSPPELVTLIASVDDPAYLTDKVVGHLCTRFPEPRAPSWSNGANYMIDRAEGVSIRREPPGGTLHVRLISDRIARMAGQ